MVLTAPARGRRWGRVVAWIASIAVLALVVLAGILWVRATSVRPSYDAFGWLVWGRETWWGRLNTSAAPSWKALPYLFTVVYALFGRTQMWLWEVTATAAAIAGWLLAGRIAYRLARGRDAAGTSPAPVAGAAPELAAGAVPALVAGVLGPATVPLTYGMWHQILIANSDPMVVTLCLAAVDAHLSRRPRLALAMLVLAALGRPEAAPFALLYGLWLSWLVPRGWWAVVGSLLVVPLGWFLVPALTSKSWFQAGRLAEGFHTAILHGSRIAGVLDRFGSLYPPAVWIAAGIALLWALWRREGIWLVLLGAALLWVVVEIAFAYHGWPAAPRYLMEPAAVVGAVGAAAAGRVLQFVVVGARGLARPASWRGSGQAAIGRGSRVAAIGVARLVLLAGLVVLALTLVPVSRARAHALRHDVDHAKFQASRVAGLSRAIAAAGGAAAVKRCAPPLSLVGNQSMLAWYLDLNVGQVGYKPGKVLRHHQPAVFFLPRGTRWRVRAVDMPSTARARCRSIKVVTSRSRLRALRRSVEHRELLWRRRHRRR